jgi:hypothetical protein
MKSYVRLFIVKEGKENLWKSWCDQIETKFKDKALRTLKQEGIIHESFINIEIDNITYTLAHIIVVGEEITPADKENDLNIRHMKIKKECLLPVQNSAKIGYSFNAF